MQLSARRPAPALLDLGIAITRLVRTHAARTRPAGLTLVRGVEVQHLMHDGRLTPHRPTEGARRAGARVLYDVGATPQLLDDG